MNYLNQFLYFQKNIPAVDVQISVGSHEELYHAMENGVIDLSLNDRRRAFSDAYNNMVLAESTLYIEISTTTQQIAWPGNHRSEKKLHASSS